MADVGSIQFNPNGMKIEFVSSPRTLVWRGFYMSVGVMASIGLLVLLVNTLNYIKGVLDGIF